MPRNWKQLERERAQLRHLSDAELTDRLRELRAKIDLCLRPGMGRNPRAARLFRGQAESVQFEIERRADERDDASSSRKPTPIRSSKRQVSDLRG